VTTKTELEKQQITSETPQKRKTPGRPRKTELKPKRGRGRPKGTEAIISEYRDRMLASPKSKKVLDAIFDAALDNEHKAQAAAWKLIIDRIAPLSAFEQEISKNGGRPNISINISGIGGDVSVSGEEDVIEGEVSEHGVSSEDA